MLMDNFDRCFKIWTDPFDHTNMTMNRRLGRGGKDQKIKYAIDPGEIIVTQLIHPMF